MDEVPVATAGLVCLIERLEGKHPRQPLYYFLDSKLRVTRTLDSTTLFDHARRLAGVIQATVPPGEPVVVVRTQGPSTILALFGVILAGCVPLVVPLAPRGSVSPIIKLMQKRGLPYVLASRKVAGQLLADLASQGGDDELPLVVLHTGERAGLRSWQPPDRSEHDILSLQWQGAPDVDTALLAVSHRNALNCLAQAAAGMSVEPGDHGLCVQPVDQNDAWLVHVLMPLYLQAPGYFLSIRNILKKPALWMEAMARFQCHYSGAPAFLFDVCGTEPTTLKSAALTRVKSLYALTARENPGALTRFMETYAPAGLPSQSLCTVYGFEHSGIWLAGRRMPDSIQHRGRFCISHGQLVDNVKAELTAEGLPPGWTSLNVVGGSDRLPFPESAHSRAPLNAERLRSLAGANWAGVPRTVVTGDLVVLEERQLYIHGRSDALIRCGDTYVGAEDIEALVMQTFQPRGIRHCLVIPLLAVGEFAVVAECARRESATRWTPIAIAIPELVRQVYHVEPTRVMLLRPNSLTPSTDMTQWRQQCREALLSGELLQYVQPASRGAFGG